MSAKEMRELSISSSRATQKKDDTYQYILEKIKERVKQGRFYVSVTLEEFEDYITYEDWLTLDGYSVKTTKYDSGDRVLHIDWLLTEDEKKEPTQR